MFHTIGYEIIPVFAGSHTKQYTVTRPLYYLNAADMTMEHDAIEVRGDEEQVTSPSDVQPTLPHKLRKQAD